MFGCDGTGRGCGAVAAEPVELVQHGDGRRAVFIRQIEELREQGEILQRQGFGCVQRVVFGSGNMPVRLHGFFIRRLSFRASAAGWRVCR